MGEILASLESSKIWKIHASQYLSRTNHNGDHESRDRPMANENEGLCP